ncbi:GumC family protein [Aminobacter sp. AP02]|uniref:GumC family protein n=1 Tax=Aminobacter sp. AP02 TaxID=2135737 RepID=UPI000D6CC725|nr:GumC family protein [Aminobacter sp. AP02]PWK65343.1 uncharacterized protein involved in exopolysaccharide biosynthesis [Aminobacter sp. AP02]
MAEPGNRDDWRRKRSLLALDQDDATPKSKGASLLSISVDEHEQARAQHPATRHRMARLRREAERTDNDAAGGGQPAADLQPNNESVSPSESAVPASSSMLGGWRDRLHGPAAPVAVAQPEGPDVASYQDQGDLDDVRWKPLIDPMKVVGGISRSKLLIASTTLVGALMGVAIALSTPKMYQAWTEMIVDPRNLKLSDQELTVGNLPSDATLAIVENQVRVLTSGSVLTKVVDKLNLAEDPEFNGTAGGGFSLRSFLRSLVSRDDADGASASRRHTLATAHLYEALTIERSSNTFVVSIGAKTEDAEKSALIANTMTEVFMQTFGELQSGTAARATGELNARLDEMRKSVEAAERKVEAFKAENELIDPQGRLITDDEIQRVNDQLTAARTRTLELNARAASTRNLGVDAVLSGTLPEAISSPTINELRAQYAALTQEADRVAVRLGPRHPERLAVEAQLTGARARIATELRRVAASIQVELKRAVQMEQELAARLAQLKVRQGNVGDELVTLRELERDVAAKRAVYEAFLLRARETGEQKDINSANVTVISTASPPLQSTGPSRAMISIAGMLLGFASGVGIGALRGALDSLRDTANRRATSAQRRRPEKAADSEPKASAPVAGATPPIASAPQDPAFEQAAPAPPVQPQPMQPMGGPNPPEGGIMSPYPPYSQAAYGPTVPQQAGYGPAVPPAGYAAPYPYPPAYPTRRPHAEAPAPQSQIDEISESLREVRKELNQLRERRTRRYF